MAAKPVPAGYVFVLRVGIPRDGARCPNCRAPMTAVDSHINVEDRGKSSRRYIAVVEPCGCQVASVVSDTGDNSQRVSLDVPGGHETDFEYADAEDPRRLQ